MMNGHDGATLMSIRDAALATGLSPKALRRRIERGTLASVMVDGRRRIPRDDLVLRGLLAYRKAGKRAGKGNAVRDLPPAVLEDRLRGLEARVQFLEAAVRAAGLPTSFLRDREPAEASPASDGRASAGRGHDGHDGHDGHVGHDGHDGHDGAREKAMPVGPRNA